MSIWGSLIGGMIGFSLGGPFGMLLGSLLGGKISRGRYSRGGFRSSAQTQQIFALSLIILSARDLFLNSNPFNNRSFWFTRLIGYSIASGLL